MSVSDDEWLQRQNKRKAAVLGAVESKAQRTTNSAEFERIVRKYPASGAMSDAFHAISTSYTGTQAHNLTVLLDNMVGGTPWADQNEEQKDTVADTMKRQVDAKPPGGEAGVRVLEARKEIITQMPGIIQMMRDYEAKYGAGSVSYTHLTLPTIYSV